MTEYDETYGVPFAFSPETFANILGEVVSRAGKKQLRIAETEKYPHVTYFFNAGNENSLFLGKTGRSSLHQRSRPTTSSQK